MINRKDLLEPFVGKKPLFLCVISNTEIAKIPGITVAGANPELIKYTPPADVELLYYGECKSISSIPATPDGKPTPALITYTALNLANIPLLVIDAGCEVKPKVPYISVGIQNPSKDIRKERAFPFEVVERSFNYSKILAENLSNLCDYMVIGESIPGGTTTALAVMLALGIDAKNKVSSSMPNNPHDLKIKVVEEAMKNLKIEFGSLKKDPLEAISKLGDGIMACILGLAIGSKVPIILAGGTQMACIASLIKAKEPEALNKVIIATTKYVVEDKTSDISSLVKEIKVNLVSVDLGLEKSEKKGLRAYSEGFVKEGVGAGGSSLACMLKTSIDSEKLRREIEKNYERIIEKKLLI
ncbi:Nicotinate-nucleotide--dimethylbenzimidazole phosphoribosyltransferase [archaeon HR06]|nr:Nicotinate-nucleotide--dimethylbenzimidazole phosphoribosyltransferase [archaeon HR06]